MSKRKSKASIWESKFLEKIDNCHIRNKEKIAKKLLRKSSSAKSSLVSRSKKYGVKFKMTLDDVRQMLYENYSHPCKYCKRTLDYKNMVFDHIIPISKDGPSTVDNIQIICKTCNGMKGSLDEEILLDLLDWLKDKPEDVQTDIRARLARGVR